MIYHVYIYIYYHIYIYMYVCMEVSVSSWGYPQMIQVNHQTVLKPIPALPMTAPKGKIWYAKLSCRPGSRKNIKMTWPTTINWPLRINGSYHTFMVRLQIGNIYIYVYIYIYIMYICVCGFTTLLIHNLFKISQKKCRTLPVDTAPDAFISSK